MPKEEANIQVDYSTQTTDPIAEYNQFYAPPWKLGVMALLRPAFYLQGRLSLSPAFLRSMPAGTNAIHQHGYPLKARREWVNKRTPLRGSKILIQGTGTGWDELSWLPILRRIIWLARAIVLSFRPGNTPVCVGEFRSCRK